MAGSFRHSWLSASWDAWALGLEASRVIALRTTKLALGRDPDGRETRLMISEKMQTAMEVQTAMLTGGLGLDPSLATKRVLKLYRNKVRRNLARLSV